MKVRLENYIEQVRGVSYQPTDLEDTLSEKSIALLRANNIQEDGLNFENLVYVSRSRVSKNQIIRSGDILICTSSGSKNLVGKAAQSVENTEITFGAFCKVVRTDKIYPRFLGHFFCSPCYRKEISHLSAGANINNIRNEHIDGLEINLPSLEEQKKIGGILDKASELISLRKKQIERLDLLVKAKFIDMFGDPVTNSMGWEETTIGDSCYYVKDGPHFSPKYVSEDQGIPFISVRNIVNGAIDWSTAKYISKEDYLTCIKKCKPEKGNMLYTKGGTTGIAKLVDTDRRFANWVHLAVLKFGDELNGVFFENMLNSDYCYRQSQILTKGIANRDLVLGSMKQIEFYIPPIDLQNAFADFVQQVEKQKTQLQQGLEKLELTYKALMQQYFN